jgi:hypothetical protein
LFRVLSLDGFIWVNRFKLIATNSTTKLKKIVLCIDAEIKIEKVVKKTRG